MRSLPATKWFAATEVPPSSLGDESLHPHAHVLAVLDTPSSGRNYVPNSRWTDIWEDSWQSACPEIAVNCWPEKLCTLDDALAWAGYATKGAILNEAAIDTKAALANPPIFLAQAEAMRNVPRFFGPWRAN